MKNENRPAVIASYQRCRSDERFIDTFYELFLATSPEIAAMFAHTDFVRQKLMLRESLLEMLSYDSGQTSSESEVEKLAQRHRELNVAAEMFQMWLDALCEAVKRHDPEFTPEIGQAWRAAMQKGINLMLPG